MWLNFRVIKNVKGSPGCHWALSSMCKTLLADTQVGTKPAISPPSASFGKGSWTCSGEHKRKSGGGGEDSTHSAGHAGILVACCSPLICQLSLAAQGESPPYSIRQSAWTIVRELVPTPLAPNFSLSIWHLLLWQAACSSSESISHGFHLYLLLLLDFNFYWVPLSHELLPVSGNSKIWKWFLPSLNVPCKLINIFLGVEF